MQLLEGIQWKVGRKQMDYECYPKSKACRKVLAAPAARRLIAASLVPSTQSLVSELSPILLSTLGCDDFGGARTSG